MDGAEIEGFPNIHAEDDENLSSIAKKKPKKSGGFNDLGLSYPVIKGVLKRGYKIPTPIQRKAIPLALGGRDIVAMARTGSGKTACFLIPLFEKLKTRQAKSGARALILSPTRELAMQTLKFIKEIGRFTDLKSIVILGGDSMDSQFSALHENPDIIVATPGRFLHLCVEMNLTLKSVRYVVFDEADRLFEMGFGDQIQEITNRLPEQRQTLLFSATLPKVLAEFAKAGLGEPILLRLDVESKLPDELKLVFLSCRPEEKMPVLLCLLKSVLKADSQVAVFAATMRHVEYINQVLGKANISSTFIYSNLDPSARKINAAKFQSKKAQVLVVTDVAARGIDIPHLACVINFNFPAKSKLFVHRVGRCARAGRSGTAYNIVAPDEYAHLLDLYLFLGKSPTVVPSFGAAEVEDGAIGKMPQSMVEEELAELNNWHSNNSDLDTMRNDCDRAYQKYIKTRPAASSESAKRAKEMSFNAAGILPEFRIGTQETTEMISRMKDYRPPGTIFEIVAKASSVDYQVMKAKRAYHAASIGKFHRLKEEKEAEAKKSLLPAPTLPSSSADEISAAFDEVIIPKKRKLEDLYKNEMRKKRKIARDEEFYIPHSAADKHTEEGLAVNNFAKDADRNQVDIAPDNDESRKLQSKMKHWDRKKKKFVQRNDDGKKKKIRTESGVWIPASYKTDRYKQWKEKSKIDSMNDDEDGKREQRSEKWRPWGRNQKGQGELKRPEQIVKARKLEEKKRLKNCRKGKKGKKGKKR